MPISIQEPFREVVLEILRDKKETGLAIRATASKLPYFQ